MARKSRNTPLTTRQGEQKESAFDKEKREAENNVPVVKKPEFKSVPFAVCGSYIVNGINIRGNRENKYTFVAQSQDMVDALDAKGFKRK